MDKNYSSIFGPSKSTGVSRARQSISGSLFSGSGRKSILPGNLPNKKTSTGYSLSTRSNISTLQVVARSDNNIVECFGLPLPVQVNEILTFSDKNVHVSANYSPNGWAWVVCGRKLLVWQFKESKMNIESIPTPRRTMAGQCRALTLPHCDIGHKATLVNVFIAEGHQMASCLAVSPTGEVRYWPSIAHDGSSIDENNILEGQEFEELLSISSQGYILVTTTCNLVQLQIQLQNGRQSIVHKNIKPPSGFFGGFGKKFASIIIGLNSNHEKESKIIKICSEKIANHEWHITVLADKWLQRWSFNASNNSESFICEDHEITRKIRDLYQQKYWSNRDASEIDFWLLDMQPTDRGVIILSAAVNKQHTPQIYYNLITFVMDNDTLEMKDVNPVKYKGFYNSERENECLNFKFIANRGLAYIYNEKTIFPIILNSSGGDEVEKIEFHAQDDAIMSAGCYQGSPLFFSRLHGLVCITPSDFDSIDMSNVSISSEAFNPSFSLNDTALLSQSILSPNTTNIGNLTMYDLNPEEIVNSDKDSVNQLKAAFIYHMKRNTSACNEIIAELLTRSELDKTVVQIAKDLAEDTPAADPRWESNQKNALGSSTSMQIVQQLREKNSALTQFIEFLHAVGLWNKLNIFMENDVLHSTCHVLSDINEKIVTAIALKCIHSSHNRIIDEAIEIILKENNKTLPYGNLTNQDLFYVKVNQIQEIFKAFVTIIENYVKLEYPTNQVQSALIEINTIVLTIMTEVTKYRDTKSTSFALPEDKRCSFEHVSWTASSGKNGIRDDLLYMIANTLKFGIKSTGESEYRHKHFQQMTELIDFVLDGRKKYLESIQDPSKHNVLLQQYESQRSDLIFPLVEGDQYELAAKLAEKYLDFQILVVICDKTNNQQRLDDYIQRYKDYDFSQFAISWHMRQNKQGDIFQRFKGNQSALAKFLSDHPSLAWIQHVFNGELAQSCEVLLMLAQNEKELLSRKRIMLSLSKLSALASEGDFSQQISEVNVELQLIELQEQLPTDILAIFGYDTKHTKVLSPEEIVDLYIAEENTKSTETEFRKALELLDYVDEPLEVRDKIWCAAILRDSWSDYNMDSPIDDMQNMMFFKLIDLCYILDGELESFLPPAVSFLRAPKLGDLVDSKSFQYLIKLGYEHIYESYAKK